MRVLYDGRGGGLGHITRGQAVGRQFILRGHEFVLLAQDNLWAVKDCPWTNLPVGRALEEFSPSLIITDTFPLGLANEYASLWDGPMAFIWRPRMDDADAVIPHLDRFITTVRPYPGGEGYILARDPSEISTRTRFFVQPRLIAYHAGSEADHLFRCCQVAAQRIPNASLTCVSPNGGRRHFQYWPIIELLPQYDVAITAGGYNSYAECRAVGIRQVVWPLPRRTDNQVARTGVERWTLTPQAVEQRIREALASPNPKPLSPTVCHGAERAVEKILRRV